MEKKIKEEKTVDSIITFPTPESPSVQIRRAIEEGVIKDCESLMERTEDLMMNAGLKHGNGILDQIGGNHYQSFKIQPSEYIDANNLPFNEGNVVKYISRHSFKNGAEDIKKAVNYCQRILTRDYNINSNVTYND